ncbi:Clp protease N-terminal domain-containing protein [Nocardia sp. CC227C]|uniref:Clp protease N-terminal domain-containing protein n=1 Tax=Nocardia sp. CC227C TaxID=3044562 RepID=UPI003556BD2A
MFERFSDNARRAIVLSQEEARLLGHNYIGTEHILLGLAAAPDGTTAALLADLGVELPALRERVATMIGTAEGEPTGHIPFTPRAKKVLELSLREALLLHHSTIQPEHLLLALVREGEGVAAQILVAVGADADRVRKAVLAHFAAAGPVPRDAPPSAEHELRQRITALEDRVAELERRLGDTPAGDTSAGATSVGDTSAGDTSVGESSAGDASAGDTSARDAGA